MSSRSQVTLPNRAADRPSPRGTIATAVLALCAGFAVAYAIRDRSGPRTVQVSAAAHAVDQAELAPPVPHSRLDEQPASANPGLPPGEAAPLPAAEMEPETETEPELAAAPEIARRPETAPAPAPIERAPEREPAPAVLPVIPPALPRSRPQPAAIVNADADAIEAQRLKPGIVAYLRCDGVPQSKGPYPCPRDREFERRVWQTLRSLEHCQALADAHGAGEVRVELSRDPTEVHVVSGDLDPKAVRQCAAGLVAARTALRPTRMIVAFRFKLD